MGALATTGGAMVSPGTLSAAHSTQNVAVAGAPGTTRQAVAAQTATTFSANTYASLTPLSRLLDELRSLLHLATATPAPVPVPKAAPADKAPPAFIWNSRYFQQVAPANPSFDATDQAAVRERAVRSTIKYLMDEEHMDDFGVTNVTIRPVSIATDADLLNVNPGARWVAEVAGVTGSGTSKSFPVVLNTDGHTYVDPRVHV